MREYIQKIIVDICRSHFNVDIQPELDRPEEKFGDYSTNVAMQLAQKISANPKEVADIISREFMSRQQSSSTLGSSKLAGLVKAEVVAPGFVNFTLSDTTLVEQLKAPPRPPKHNTQEVIVEFGDPNPFKEMHLGHLYSTIIGDNIARLLKADGASVRRVSYQGDVGMHVAKAIYGIGEEINWDTKRLNDSAKTEPESLMDHPNANFKIGYLYAKGAKAFSDDKVAANKIRTINKAVYNRNDQVINAIYDWGLKTSFAYFDSIFDILDVKYDKRYLESQTAPIGMATVKANIGTIFEQSQGAVIYNGDQESDLHTRVFINSEGLPTYETKDLGLAELKDKDYPKASKSIIITAQEQSAYFRVVLAALKQLHPELAAKTTHIAHGFLSLSSGKMSSRTGDVHSAQRLLSDVLAAVKKAFPDSNHTSDIFMAAIRYTFLKNRTGSDLVFDVKSSVTLEGNSGPYLQYSYARACGIKRKLKETTNKVETIVDLTSDERSLVRKIGEYNEIVGLAVDALMPHYICTYLYELAQNFNHFYENNPVIGNERQNTRLQIINFYTNTLSSGLSLLGIATPEEL